MFTGRDGRLPSIVLLLLLLLLLLLVVVVVVVVLTQQSEISRTDVKRLGVLYCIVSVCLSILV